MLPKQLIWVTHDTYHTGAWACERVQRGVLAEIRNQAETEKTAPDSWVGDLLNEAKL